jgi:hypothetical protein
MSLKSFDDDDDDDDAPSAFRQEELVHFGRYKNNKIGIG